MVVFRLRLKYQLPGEQTAKRISYIIAADSGGACCRIWQVGKRFADLFVRSCSSFSLCSVSYSFLFFTLLPGFRTLAERRSCAQVLGAVVRLHPVHIADENSEKERDRESSSRVYSPGISLGPGGGLGESRGSLQRGNGGSSYGHDRANYRAAGWYLCGGASLAQRLLQHFAAAPCVVRKLQPRLVSFVTRGTLDSIQPSRQRYFLSLFFFYYSFVPECKYTHTIMCKG